MERSGIRDELRACSRIPFTLHPGYSADLLGRGRLRVEQRFLAEGERGPAHLFTCFLGLGALGQLAHTRADLLSVHGEP